jgi:hypothetical protein
MSRAARRLADPQVVGAVRALLREGRSAAFTGEELVDLVQLQGVACRCVRRVQEAIRFLRAERMQIASGPEGYWIETDPEILRLTLVTHKRRVAHAAEAIRWLEPDTYARIQLALNLERAA